MFITFTVALTSGLAGIYAITYVVASIWDPEGSIHNPSLLLGLLVLALSVYLASPIDATPSQRRIVMVVLILFAAANHGVQIYNAGPLMGSKIQATCGSIILMCGFYFFSTNRGGVPADVVGLGFCVQYFMGMFVLTTETGASLFEALGLSAGALLDFSKVGSAFVFADLFNPFNFATSVLPTTIYFSAFVSALTYIGVLQVIVKSVAASLKKLIGTNLVQSVNAAANLFLGMTEAPLLILPFLPKASPSDIHCVMVGGFASIAGAVLVAYISFGIDAAQLLGASVMSVPGTLVVSNLICPPGSYPEEEVEKEEGEEEVAFEFPPPTESNVVEAAGNGIQTAIPLVLNIGAMLIAFLSLLELMNATLGLLGGLVGVPQLTFQFICSYALYPVAFFLGAPLKDCSNIATIIGTKLFVNEFLAYELLADLGKSGAIDPQSVLIGTYACCGFANVGSLGIMLGGMSVLCPQRSRLFGKVVIRAMLAGNTVSWLNASYAAVLKG